MRIYELRAEQRFGVGIRDTFEFFEQPTNLEKITPPWLGFRILNQDVVMAKGAEIDYTIQWMSLPLRWKTVIDDYEPPFRFVDVQARGPYSLWHHTHTFSPHEDGTAVIDVVRYALPLGAIGEVAHWAMVRRQLLRIFRYRQEVLAKLLGGVEAERSDPLIRAA